MIAAFLLVMQATPQGVAERDARELAEMLTGTWNNTEAADFAGEMGEALAPSSVEIAPDGQGGLVYRSGTAPGGYGPPIRLTLSAGEPGRLASPPDAPCEVYGTRMAGDGFLLTAGGSACEGFLPGSVHAVVTADSITDDGALSLRRADPYACWVSRKKDGATGEGGWTWTPDVTVREGEYVQLPDDPGVARPAGIKLRHVRWPYGENRDSLVLYVHEAPGEPAVSYAWTEPDAERIALNLRWVQASCTRSTG